MNDLISKNDLYKKCESLHKRLVEGKITDKEAFRDLFNAVADAPPVTDVKEVVHGHWKRNAMRTDGTPEAVCSLCGEEVTYRISEDVYNRKVWRFAEYCAGCGAKMEGSI